MPKVTPSPFMGSKAWDIFREMLSEKRLWKKERYGKRSDMRWMGRKKWERVVLVFKGSYSF